MKLNVIINFECANIMIYYRKLYLCIKKSDKKLPFSVVKKVVSLQREKKM